MKNRARRHAIVFDLEFTAWEGSQARGWSEPGELKEVVQIGAVKLDAEALKIIDHFQMLVRPRVNPVISEYLVQLTGISNAALETHGVDFAIAYPAFLDFCGDDTVWAFGRDDIVLEQNLKLYGLDGALKLSEYHNVLPWFAELGLDLKGKHACDVGPAAGVLFEGRKHDALADAHSVALGMIAMIQNGAANPFIEKREA